MRHGWSTWKAQDEETMQSQDDPNRNKHNKGMGGVFCLSPLFYILILRRDTDDVIITLGICIACIYLSKTNISYLVNCL